MSFSRPVVSSMLAFAIVASAILGSISSGCQPEVVRTLHANATVKGYDLNEHQLSLELDESESGELSRLIADHVGDRIEVRVDGIMVMKPLVREAIEGSAISITWVNDDLSEKLRLILAAKKEVALTIRVTE